MKMILDLPEEAGNRIAALEKKTEGTTGEVLGNALRLFEDAIKVAEGGETFLIRGKNGELREYHIFG